MKYLVDSKTMKAIDEAAQTQTGVPAIVLMERAALAVAEAVKQQLSGREPGQVRILAVCGTGNNGGDGIAAARILYEWGYEADIYVVGEPTRGSELFQKQLQIAENCGLKQVSNHRHMKEYTVLIDALFGIGLTRTIEGIYADCIREMEQAGVPVVAVDMPSGINADNGGIAGVAVHAAMTVTFGYSKIGLQIYPGREYAGEIQIADIGFPKILEKNHVFPAFYYEEDDLALRPARREYSNKGTYGKVAVVAGSKDMCGACYLSADAAFRTGVGMVKVLTVKENVTALHMLLPEAIVTTWEPERIQEESEMERICQELSWADAIVLGPGLGRSQEAGVLVSLVLDRMKVPMVIDADALHHVAENPKYVAVGGETGMERQLCLGANMVLTPHLKEMADMLECQVSQIQADIVQTARTATEGKDFVLVLKDARTVVAGAEQSAVYINESGNCGMATAGSGDVLTGVIGALLAQGMKEYEAAALGVYLHGLAGDVAAEKVGKPACMAGDIINGLTGFR